jgi:hypothetical protein
MCRKPLVEATEHPADRDAILGEEAHIISESRKGPRGTALVPGMDFDTYYNRILLCRNDHRIVDERPHEYTVEKLRGIKSRHEQWVRERLHVLPDESKSTPIGLKHKHPDRGMVLPSLKTGKSAWLAAVGSSFYLIESVDEDEASTEACDAADRFLTTLRDCAEISDAITDRGFESIREAQRDLREGLDELASHDLAVFGAQRDMFVTGGGAPPSPCTMAVVIVRPRAEVGDEDLLPVAFPTKPP